MQALAARLALGPVTPGSLAAGGSLAPDASPGLWRRAWLTVELALIFIAAPLALHGAVHGYRVPLFLALFPVLLVALAILAADPAFHLVKEWRRGVSLAALASIVAVLLVFGGAVVAWIHLNHPGWLLEFPRRRPDVYYRVMLLYPLFSVAAQELIYRTFYFHRYGPLFGRHRWLGIVLNGVLFGFGHVVVGTPFAVAATTVTGLLFAMRYAATRSFWAVFLEHTLWGWLVFTAGLGRFFFTGVSNVG